MCRSVALGSHTAVQTSPPPPLELSHLPKLKLPAWSMDRCSPPPALIPSHLLPASGCDPSVTPLAVTPQSVMCEESTSLCGWHVTDLCPQASSSSSLCQNSLPRWGSVMSLMWMGHSCLSIHRPEALGLFQFSALVNHAVLNIGGQLHLQDPAFKWDCQSRW